MICTFEKVVNCEALLQLKVDVLKNNKALATKSWNLNQNYCTECTRQVHLMGRSVIHFMDLKILVYIRLCVCEFKNVLERGDANIHGLNISGSCKL